MSPSSKERLVAALLERHGRTYAEELGIDLRRETPSALFRMLTAALLFSARIGAAIAVRGARALSEAGWTSARKMCDAEWSERARVLNESGYARYDERTATMLGETSALLLDRYGGDLRRLRKEAGADPRHERMLLKQFKGIGDVGVDIFFREAQAVWDELRPFADRRVRAGAKSLGLPVDPTALARLVTPADQTRLFAALARLDIEGGRDEVRKAASG